MAKYSEEQTAKVEGFINSYGGEVIPYSDFEAFVDSFGEDFSEKSLSAKIRFMGGNLEKKVAKAKVKTFSEEDEQIIKEMTSDPDNMPFLEEIAERLGKEPKQVRGKLVSMKVRGVKKRDVKEPKAKAFTEEDEQLIRDMTSDPDNLPFIEDIAERLNVEVKKLRGKIASMKIKGVRSKNTKAPKAKIYTDELKEELKELVKSHTIEQIAEMKNLNFIGLRSILGKMGLIEKKAKAVYWTDERVNELKQYVSEGKDYKEIGELMSKNPLVIAKKVKQLQATEDAA